MCKICNVWISNHPANIASHEASDLHKVSIRKKIREAEEIRKKSEIESSEAKKELERVTKAAVGVSSRIHPLDSTGYVISTKPQSESEWLTCRTDSGRLYYANVITGMSQWHKPVAMGGIEQSEQSNEPTEKQGPPKPRTVAQPPPRPKTIANPLKKQVGHVEEVKLLEAVYAQEVTSHTTSREVDPSTGLGEWETVAVESELPSSSGFHGVKELKRPIVHDGMHVGFSRTITRKNRRITREED